jgi:ABC-type transport system involved in multi-copper enzyme maturation permease subunit
VNACHELRAIARLDFAEVRRSRWLPFAAAVFALLGAAFVWVGLRESSILGFTGLGRALLSLSHALVLLLPLLALAATVQTVNRAREDGTLELLFGGPLRRWPYLVAVALTRWLALFVPLAALFAAMAAIGGLAFRQAVPWVYLLRATAISAALLLAFVGVGLAVSTLVRSQARAMLVALLVWAACAALLDFGLLALLLRMRLAPEAVFALGAVNPVQAARLALIAGAEPELSVLGPVGHFLSTRLGQGPLLALGIAWPAALGVGGLGVALARFSRGDLI